MNASPRFTPELRRAARAMYIRSLAEAWARWAAWCLPGLALLFLIGVLMPPLRLWSGVMAGLAALWVVGSTAGILVPAILGRWGLQRYALWIEDQGGLKRNELINAVQLERDRARWRSDPISLELIERSIRRAADRLRDLPLSRLHARRRILPRAGLGLLALVPILLLWILAPLTFGDTVRLFLAAGDPSVVPAVAISVHPGDLKVERGASVSIEATVAGRRRPAKAHLEMRRPGGEWNRVDMLSIGMAGTGSADRDRYQFVASNLNGDLEYRVRAGWAQSVHHRIHVLDRLQALGYRKLYRPPEYTGLPEQREVSSTGDMAALFGTDVNLEVRHRRPGATGFLHFLPDGPRRPLTDAGNGALEVGWRMRESGDFLIRLLDPAEDDRWVSDTFHVEVVPDLAPAIRVLAPRQNIKMPADMIVTLVVECLDDFGITELAIVYGRPGDDPRRDVLAEWSGRQKEARVTYNWNMDEVALLPDQELHYFLQLSDNDPLNGPKMTETEVFSVRFPSLAEMYTDAEQGREQEILSLEEALTVQEDLQEQLKRVAQEMLREEKISWEKSQEVNALLDQQKALAEKVQQIQESLEQSRERMENQNLFSMEMIEKVHAIQDLINQVQSEEFQKLVEQMNQALREMNQAELQKAMEQMQVTQQEITESLDRTLQMLKRLLAEEKIDRMLADMQKLAAMQEAINRQLEERREAQAADRDPSAESEPQGEAGSESDPDRMDAEPGAETAEQEPEAESGDRDQGSDATEQAGDQQDPKSAASDSLSEDEPSELSKEEAEELARQQEALREELEKLQKELEELARETGQDYEELAKMLEEMQQQPSQQETPKQMQQAQEFMEQLQRKNALKFGRKAKQGLEQMLASLMDIKQEIDLDAVERLAQRLYDTANRMVVASLRQEEVIEEAGGTDGPRDLAISEQQLVEEMAALSDSLYLIARETPMLTRTHLRAMGEARGAMIETRTLFETGRRAPALRRAREATVAVDYAVKILVEAASQMRSNCASTCANPFNKMQNLTGQQSELNQQTQDMFQGMQAQRPSQTQQEAMLGMAARQEMIRQGLAEVREELEQSGKLMGDLGQAIDEMEEVVREMRKRNVDRQVIERQEQILSRLLSAQRSVRKRDQSEERQSHVGVTPLDRVSPEAVEMGASRSEILQRSMLRGANDPVPAEYRGMVERYMQALLRGTRP